MDFLEIFLLAVALSMDAFAVSICKGLASKKVGMRECLLCGVWFGAFQGLMPFIGYLISSRFEKWISIIAPWTAFVLLSIIGFNMIREAFSEDDENTNAEFGIKTMFLLAVATSIDALAVGITFVAVPIEILPASHLLNTVFACAVIAVTTFVISSFGVKLGYLFGMRYKSGSEVMGGTILIFIGLRTLLNSLLKSGEMNSSGIVFGMLIPLAGTILGAALVFIRRFKLTHNLRSILTGVTAGVLLSIAVWGMIKPSIQGLIGNGAGTILLLVLCFGAGLFLSLLLNRLLPHTHDLTKFAEGSKGKLSPEFRLMLSEAVHHLPEAFTLGTVFAAFFLKAEWISIFAALVLAFAISIRTFSEAVLISLPIAGQGEDTGKAFFAGIVSGIPVPLLGILVLIIMLLLPPVLPYVMSAAAGAVVFTVIRDGRLVISGEERDKGILSFIAGFAVITLLLFL